MRKIGFDRWESVRLVNGQAVLRAWLNYSNSASTVQASILVVEALTGNRLFAMGQFVDPTIVDPSTVCLGVDAVGDRGIALAIGHVDAASNAIHYYLTSSSWAAPNALEFHDFSLPALGLDSKMGQINQGSIGTGSLFLELKAPEGIGIYNVDTFQFRTASPMLIGEGTMAVTDGALVFEYNKSYGVDLAREDGTWLNVIPSTAPPSRRVSAYGVDRSRSQQLAWVESSYGSGSWSNSIIWTAPYVTSAALLQPRRTATLGDAMGRGGLYMSVNAGMALNLVDKDKALLTRLSDGAGWILKAEPGDAFTIPLWVDDNEVWLGIGDASEPNWMASYTGMVRYARSSLGGPVVDAGF